MVEYTIFIILSRIVVVMVWQFTTYINCIHYKLSNFSACVWVATPKHRIHCIIFKQTLRTNFVQQKQLWIKSKLHTGSTITCWNVHFVMNYAHKIRRLVMVTPIHRCTKYSTVRRRKRDRELMSTNAKESYFISMNIHENSLFFRFLLPQMSKRILYMHAFLNPLFLSIAYERTYCHAILPSSLTLFETSNCIEIKWQYENVIVSTDRFSTCM